MEAEGGRHLNPGAGMDHQMTSQEAIMRLEALETQESKLVATESLFDYFSKLFH